MNKDELKKQLDNLSNKSSVEEVQKYIKDMFELRGFRTNLLERMCILTEEVGELAKEVRKTDNNIGIDINKNYNSSLENEITDVFICLMGMCELLDMDIIDGLKNKEEINFKREWRKI
ncbi:MAG: nucleotide pyrophosphohydrolase [Clostridia bacterium]|nr:nucleotide pyrophosphohydrolase [Clostridia bacterium]